ncbi:flagellar filament capping protein FliD [Nocardioides euryhalodurans]|uniref:Flagellar hook-associated protein 2 n=1 Tax=Nocardioides euryhalodurans TaxID=2518370 RepID=A0A4P7GKR6_9ACTN|nr:flagellar filament capping protein FliD [Nocardioides euryhalodurans]QBR92364.1 hypothetical protein EXE57_08755 [Nocardioides euryhalodurans]
MSGAASISGLASGLDTATIIDQLMQLEAVPQARLRSRVSSEQLVVNALQTLNAKVASLTTKAADLAKASAWSPVTATSSNTGVSIATSSAAGPVSFSVRVDRTSASHRLELTDAAALDEAGSVPSTVRLDRLDGTTSLDLTTDGTLQGLVDAINAPANATGLHATTVKVGEGSYRLLVESTSTGAASDFTLADAGDGSPVLGGATVRAGRDAQITLGDSIVVTSASNTFTDVVTGVSLTLAADATGTSEIAVRRDTNALTSQVQGMVDAVNNVLADIDSLTGYNATTKASGLLAGDTNARSLRSALLETVFPADGSSLAGLGVQTDRTGKLVFDATTFKEAYAADPAGAQARFTTTEEGFASRLHAVAKGASDKIDGTLTTAVTGRNDAIRRLNDSIDAWDQRLELRRSSLTRQFTALETALSQMSSQSSWLAGQINSLPSTGSGS